MPPATLLLLAAGTALGACAAVPGTATYGCGGLPAGVSCRSAREVYRLIDGGKPVVALPGQATALDPGSSAAGAPPAASGEAAVSGDRVPAPATAPSQGPVQAIALRPEDAGAPAVVPLRTPARVLRVWIAPWEDERDRLHVPGYTYVEVEPRRWSIGQEQPGGGRRLRPLATPPGAPPPVPVPPGGFQVEEAGAEPSSGRQRVTPPRRQTQVRPGIEDAGDGNVPRAPR